MPSNSAGEPLLHLAYASRMRPEHVKELPAIVARAADKNAELGVVGCLSENQGTIVQILQGPEDRLVELYDTIATDPRHFGIIELIRIPIRATTMSGWAMVRWPMDEVYSRVHP